MTITGFDDAPPVALTVNGRPVRVRTAAMRRLSRVLREDLGLKGTKVGCDAGDCGACTVLLDGEPVCACMVPMGRLDGRSVTTVEGLGGSRTADRLRRSFHAAGAAQCGICTPAMLVAATHLLDRDPRPAEAAVTDAIGGVLCRCTGYRKIVDAILSAASEGAGSTETGSRSDAGPAVGRRLARLDGAARLDGTERYGDDVAPADALWLKVVRSPHAHARFAIGPLDALRRRYPGVVRVLVAADVPGFNRFGVIPGMQDQPVFAETHVRYRGEAIAALVGDAATMEAFDEADFPVVWEPLPPLSTPERALAPGAAAVHADRPDNVLVRGHLRTGDVETALAGADIVVGARYATGFVEHAYIEPEAGYARRVGDRIEIAASTQAPYMDRHDIAAILGLPEDRVRIVPTAVGGGFGGKLDLSVQPYLAVAAWHLDRPVRCVYGRSESMAASTKRHPAAIDLRIGARRDGTLLAMDFRATFDTGAYASWGPTVANRVPVHCTGPYRIPAVRARTRAVHTHNPPSGAFRGFGVPQAAIAQEGLFDDLAEALGIDRLDLRLKNALRAGDVTATGQRLEHGVGMAACLEALRPRWRAALAEAAAVNAAGGAVRRGVGIAAMWYGCGNTGLPNPSTIRVGLRRDGVPVLYQGAVDIGQGSDTVITQICADAVGLPVGRFERVPGDTDRTADAGKTSASRQTFVSGRAAQRAGEALRREILRRANAGDTARLALDGASVVVDDGGRRRVLDLSTLPADRDGIVLAGEGTFDPPTVALDENGQGVPYATYGFGAQIAEVAVDLDLGTVRVLHVTAAHDVGRAINPTLVEGQIEGGVAQGIGFALMEDYVPGRTENLHDYLIPTAGDVPPVTVILIEDPEPLGPFGAKGVGEQALIPTAPAILGAVRHAAGIAIRTVPATPDRVRAAILGTGRPE